MTVRLYQKETDEQQVLDIYTQSSYVGHPFLTKEFIATSCDKVKNVYLPNTTTFVFEKEDRII
eukprot:Awhi_evm1s12911